MAKHQTIPKGSHFTRMFQRFWGIYEVTEKEVIDIIISGRGLRYNHGDSDQKDWNKLEGDAYNPYSPHGKTVMTGWRHNLEADTTELIHYYHGIEDTEGRQAVGSVPGYIIPNKILSLPIKHGASHVRIERSTYSDGTVRTVLIDSSNQSNVLTDDAKFNKLGKYKTRINLYFGGQKKATNRIFSRKEYHLKGRS